MGTVFIPLRVLGRGTYGEAILVSHASPKNAAAVGQQHFVVKRLLINVDLKQNQQAAFLREVQILSSLSHPHITRYIGAWVEPDGSFCMAMEYCDGGDLEGYLKEHTQPLSETLIKQWLVQGLSALEYCHTEKRVLHRDIKLQNIFLHAGTIKLGDFGIARLLPDATDFTTTRVGTPYFLSPEIVQSSQYDHRTDVWSLGVVLFELLTRHKPFRGKSFQELYRNIVLEPLPDVYALCAQAGYSGDLAALCQTMLNRNASSRPSASALLHTPWLRELNSLHFESAKKLLFPAHSPVRRHAPAPNTEVDPFRRQVSPSLPQGASEASRQSRVTSTGAHRRLSSPTPHNAPFRGCVDERRSPLRAPDLGRTTRWWEIADGIAGPILVHTSPRASSAVIGHIFRREAVQERNVVTIPSDVHATTDESRHRCGECEWMQIQEGWVTLRVGMRLLWQRIQTPPINFASGGPPSDTSPIRTRYHTKNKSAEYPQRRSGHHNPALQRQASSVQKHSPPVFCSPRNEALRAHGGREPPAGMVGVRGVTETPHRQKSPSPRKGASGCNTGGSPLKVHDAVGLTRVPRWQSPGERRLAGA